MFFFADVPLFSANTWRRCMQHDRTKPVVLTTPALDSRTLFPLSAKRIAGATKWRCFSLSFSHSSSLSISLMAALTLLAGGMSHAQAATSSVASSDGRHAANGSAAARSPGLVTALKDYDEDNYPVALREFKAEAMRGNRIAEFDYAMMLLKGEGVDPDLKNALIWLKKAADANMSHAQFIYGRIYDEGQLVPPDPTLAHRWFLKAAKQGHVQAEIALATQYMDGRGTPRDYSKAFTWYLKAAKAGDEASEYIVASFYEKGGDGVKINYTSARIWYALAAQQGDVAAAAKYAEVAARQKETHSDDPDHVPHSHVPAAPSSSASASAGTFL